jgi:hypothetical protein
MAINRKLEPKETANFVEQGSRPDWFGNHAPSARGLRKPGFYGRELMEFLRGLELEEETLP